MSKYDGESTARLPLVEVVIVVAIFIVISVMIMSLYVKADHLQREAVDRSEAAIRIRNFAEEILATAGSGDITMTSGEMKHELLSADAPGKSVTFFYNDKWENVDEADADILITISYELLKSGAGGNLLGVSIASERLNTKSLTPKLLYRLGTEVAY